MNPEQIVTAKIKEIEQILENSKTIEEAKDNLFNYFARDFDNIEDAKRTLDIQGVPVLIDKLANDYFDVITWIK